ncbi:hypothetical protein DBV05_g11058 [Lasiodiplodia theobromae]|uniref:Peptidase S8/S53 domain-containing protein n=1 Tax=Lasiodiplodia theobromae TaxID=45133 RepID=A0A5N5CY09_9PEZI|nr:hypothetical protein DBV05_g11058 [Lasiodiplodia theobromae]
MNIHDGPAIKAGDNGEEDSDSTSSGEENDTISALFERLIRDLTSPEPPSLDDVLKHHKNELKETTEEGDTILHLIAADRKKTQEATKKFKPLLSHLLEHHPNLMKQKDANEKTPLQLAIKKKRATLVETMCDAMDSNHDVDEILFIADSQGNNCLHEALQGSASNSHRIALDIIARVHDGQWLRCQNLAGRTPLHIAVEYDRCTPSQLCVVRKLLDTCDEALDANVGGDPRELSVYRYHEQTRREHMEKQKAKSAAADHEKDRNRDHRQPNVSKCLMPQAPVLIPAAPRENAVAMMRPEMNLASEMPLQGIRRAPTIQTAPGGFSAHAGVAHLSVRQSPTVTDAEARKKGKKKVGGKKKVEEESVTEESANEIRDLLKLRFMMNSKRDHETTVSFLYGAIQQKELFFSLVDGPVSLSKQILEDSRHFKFEDTLRYVELPQLEIERPVPSKFVPKRAVPDGHGRTDYAVVFEWLRKKGVKRILSLSVSDLKEPSHSEETIEEALRDIEVIKLWDWQRSDLSPETIFKAAKNVEEVYLYWNGNEAVLRSWGEPEGLNKLRNLKKVTVFETQHKWITCMEEFADFIQRVKLDDSGLNQVPPITVALIDDGYDISEPGLNSKIVGGRSFCRHNSRNNHASYFVTRGGHGTVMANQICRAVRAAIALGVDIISMSWTLEATPQNKDHITHLTTALTDAAKANILLFCAAPDQGADTTRTYPAAASAPCIRIGAAEASGEAYEWLGAAPVDFLFPGANVLWSRPGDLAVDSGTGGGGRLTGSSVATALAAGLAALALYCVQFAVQYAVVANAQQGRQQQVTAEDLRNLKTRHGMEAAFHAIGMTAAS